MAAATTLQCVSFLNSQQNHGQALCRSSLVRSHVNSFRHRNNIYCRRIYRSTRVPRLKISCTSQKQDDDSNIIKNVSNELNVSNPSTPVTTRKEVPSTNFVDVFAFGGPAPELINGRLAMLGFVSALGVEIATGQDLLWQLQNGGFRWFLLTAFLFTTASLAPIFQGVSPQSKSNSFFSTKAETWNGRAAMVGLVALALTEYAKGGALF